jgi:hypothetical protein
MTEKSQNHKGHSITWLRILQHPSAALSEHSLRLLFKLTFSAFSSSCDGFRTFLVVEDV